MHWTATLARRAYPASATIIDDLACGRCGYNLRGARAVGVCPECGLEVGTSIRLLTQPGTAAGALRSLGWSYLGPFALLAGCIPYGAVPALLIMGGAAAFRLLAAHELRFKTSLSMQPRLGRLVNALHVVSVVEVALLLLAILSWVTAAPVATSPVVAYAGSAAAAGWTVATIASLLVAGWLGRGIADMLGYDGFKHEFTAQIALIAAPLLTVPLATGALGVIATSQPISGRSFAFALALAGVPLWLIAILVAVIALQHLGNVVEQDSGERDEVVDTEPGPQPRPLPQHDLPDVPLD